MRAAGAEAPVYSSFGGAMRRLLLAAAVLSTAILAPSAGAAAQPHIIDPAGDVATRQEGYDLTAVRFATGRTRAGDKELVIRMTLVAPPTYTPAHHFEVAATVGKCSFYAFANFNESEYAGWQFSCPGEEGRYLNLPTAIDGHDVVWRFPLNFLPMAVRSGALLTDLRAHTGLQDPWFGEHRATLDDAVGETSYRIG